jgi:hypothetical protein
VSNRKEKGELSMIDRAENIVDLTAILHPGCVYAHPRDVDADATNSTGEKRAILASWASDAAAVLSNPALRELPGSYRLSPLMKCSRRYRHWIQSQKIHRVESQHG